ncbi:MAG TPA: Ig domain-containing protein [Chthoniobacteraceae bacterium]|jgi:hypothetical protein|nr:Ig domain-containing protein [Chthoniobacteraceae bacterium]
MAKPQISRNTGLLGSLQWAAYNLQLALLQGAGVTWTAVGLPPGLSIDGSTGLISGAPTAYGLWHPVVKAANGDGADQVVLYIPIVATTASAGPDVDLKLNLATRAVEPNVPGAIPSPSGATADAPGCVAKEGDDLFFSLQVTKNNVIQDLDVSEFRVTLKEADTEAVICAGGGGTAAVDGVHFYKKYGSGATTVYRLYMKLAGELVAAALADQEDDSGSFFDGRLEFEVEFANTEHATFGPEIPRLAFQTMPIRVIRPQQPAA